MRLYPHIRINGLKKKYNMKKWKIERCENDNIIEVFDIG